MEKTIMNAGVLRTTSTSNKSIFFSSFKKSTVVEIISSLLIILFVYASLNKLLDYNTFKFQLGRSPYVMNLAEFAAWAIPFGELLIAATLVFKRTKLFGLYLSFFLMLLFTGYIYAMLNYSYFLPCSCGGILSDLDWHSHLIFNIIFTLLALIGIFFWKKA